jgi:hypothetical protein
MELNGYALVIKPGTENNGYVEIEHNTQYSVFLINNNPTRCDARLSIDGVVVGTLRVNPEDCIKLERGTTDNGKFTFYRLGSKEANQSKLSINESLGLIKCVFKPEDVDTYYENNTRGGGLEKSVTRSMGSGQSFAGGTGLSGRSNQKFSTASEIEHYDENKTTTIYLRLVCKDAPEIVDNIRPLRRNATDIPRPII